MCICACGYVFGSVYISVFIYIKISRSTKRCVCLGLICFFCSHILVCFQLDAFVREYVCHKVLFMGYLMRLELSCLQFEWFSVGYGFF